MRVWDYIVTARSRIFICALFAYVFGVLCGRSLGAGMAIGLFLFAASFWIKCDPARWPVGVALWTVIALAVSFFGGFFDIGQGLLMATYIFIPGILIALGSGRDDVGPEDVHDSRREP